MALAGCSAGSQAPGAPESVPTLDASSTPGVMDAAVEPDAAPAGDASFDATDAALPTEASAPSSWTDLGALPVGADGQTAALTLPWATGQGGFALEVASSPFRCLQIGDLADGAATLYVGPDDYGPYCTTCAERVAVAGGAGVFVLPSGASPFAPVSPLTVRFALRDCDTLGSPADLASPVTVTARIRPLAPPPAHGAVALRVLVTPASTYYPDARTSDLVAALTAVNGELSSANLTANAETLVRASASAPSDATFSLGDPSQLTALIPRGFGTTSAVTVVLAGCLELDDPLLGGSSEVQGYTPHIPGGAGPADAVFIKGALCGTPSLIQVAYAPATLARVLAHEIGHYLGLYHSVEADGTTDTLPDTGADNLMFYQPSVASATGLSPDQGTVLRRHPRVTPSPP